MCFVTTFIPFLVVRNSNVTLIRGSSSPFNKLSKVSCLPLLVLVVAAGCRVLPLLHLQLWRPNQHQPSLGAQSSCGSGSLTYALPWLPPTSWTSPTFWQNWVLRLRCSLNSPASWAVSVAGEAIYLLPDRNWSKITILASPKQ